MAMGRLQGDDVLDTMSSKHRGVVALVSARPKDDSQIGRGNVSPLAQLGHRAEEGVGITLRLVQDPAVHEHRRTRRLLPGACARLGGGEILLVVAIFDYRPT